MALRNYSRKKKMIKRTHWTSKKPSSAKYNRYKPPTRNYGKKRKTSFLRGTSYKQALSTRSAISHKLHSVKTTWWTTECKSGTSSQNAMHEHGGYRVEEISPYKSTDVFWKKAGGALIDNDISAHRIYCRGGEWRLSIYNSGSNDADIDTYLAFCYDGADYETLEGTVDKAWHPHMAGKRFHDAMKLTNSRKSFVLKKGSTKKFMFKIGSYNINVAEWFTKKKGWPFFYVVFAPCDPEVDVKLKITMTVQITFTEGEDTKFAMSRDDMNKITRSIKLLQSQLLEGSKGGEDTRMDSDAAPSIS